MNAVVQTLNSAGWSFVNFALPMLIQSSVLILIVLLVDLALRRRVRAVFRYWIWLLVLLKLVLPPSLWSPLSIGTWLGETLEPPMAALYESPASQGQEPANAWQPQAQLGDGALPGSPIAKGFALDAATPVDPAEIPEVLAQVEADSDPVTPTLPVPTPSWQALVLLAWTATALVLLLLLLQRALFVKGLVAQAQDAPPKLVAALNECRVGMGLARKVALRVSPNATSPAVCGLLCPVILIPRNLAPKLRASDLQAVLLHELAHIKRGDLWVNLIQTLLQIVYFYNPLLWLANAAIRRVREQAVDEAVLVAMGDTARDYPQTLVNIAKLAFKKRPALSLRLIGVVESKSALSGRIKHILSRPIPKSTRLGLLGLAAILTTAAFLLPMAKAERYPKRIGGIDENLNVSDKSGSLTIHSLHMAPTDGKRMLGMNEGTLSVTVENASDTEKYLGLEYYADGGTIGGVYSPGASSRTQVLAVPTNWQGALDYSIDYPRFTRNGYIRILLAKCKNPRVKEFVSPEVEILHDRKYPVFTDEDLQPAESNVSLRPGQQNNVEVHVEPNGGRRGQDTTEGRPYEIAGRVVDPNGHLAAGVQVAISTAEIGVIIRNGTLQQPRTSDMEKGQIVETDSQGRFRFDIKPTDEFDMIAAHEAGFALVSSEQFAGDRTIRLQPWGRIEGTLATSRRALEEKIWMSAIPNMTWRKRKRQCRYETLCDADGRFTFERVPAGRFEVGYLASTGRGSASLTSRTPIEVQAGQTAPIKLGGEGRPVIGRFVPPSGYDGPLYFGAGLRALVTARLEGPKPENYDRMTRREQQAWRKQWRNTLEAKAFYDAMWRNPDWRHYCFQIHEDGTFRIEDVIPGTYDMNVWLEERFTGQGRPEEIGSYTATIEMPEMTEAYSAEPLDLGDLALKMRTPLHVGDTAPLFEAKTLDGKDIRLIDYRGKFVLLSFWSPTFHPELDRLKKLHAEYEDTGRLQIIGLGGTDTLDEVKSYVEEHDIEWSQIYFGSDWDADLLRRLGGQMQILLIDPEGKVVATWLRDEKLTDTVRDALAFAWERTDRYVAPDAEGFFPDDVEGGRRLDALFTAPDKDERSDEEIFATVRAGFRRTTKDRELILRWISHRYIWHTGPQHPEVIEIMYHAVPMEVRDAIGFGLSMVRDKTPNILRTLANICMRNEEIKQVAGSIGDQRDELVAYIRPYLTHEDLDKRKTAAAIIKHLNGELNFQQWKEARRVERVRAEFGNQLPHLNEILLIGGSDARREAIATIKRNRMVALLDDSFLPAMRAAAGDPDRKVRGEIASIVGNRWVSGAEQSCPEAIALLLQFSLDEDRLVRYKAVYHGLSVVQDKTEPVMRRLVELALADHKHDLYGRIVWGLRRPREIDRELFTRILAEHLERAKSDLHHGASVLLLHRDILETEPPDDWPLAHVRERCPEDVFVLSFEARKSFKPASADALWNAFIEALPDGITVERLPEEGRLCNAGVWGREQVEIVYNLNYRHVRIYEPLPMLSAERLWREEMRGIAPQ